MPKFAYFNFYEDDKGNLNWEMKQDLTAENLEQVTAELRAILSKDQEEKKQEEYIIHLKGDFRDAARTKEIFEIIKDYGAVKTVTMNDCMVGQSGISNLVDLIGFANRVELMDVNLGKNEMLMIADAMARSRKIVEVNLEGNFFDSSVFGAIFNAANRNKNIVTIDYDAEGILMQEADTLDQLLNNNNLELNVALLKVDLLHYRKALSDDDFRKIIPRFSAIEYFVSSQNNEFFKTLAVRNRIWDLKEIADQDPNITTEFLQNPDSNPALFIEVVQVMKDKLRQKAMDTVYIANLSAGKYLKIFDKKGAEEVSEFLGEIFFQQAIDEREEELMAIAMAIYNTGLRNHPQFGEIKHQIEIFELVEEKAKIRNSEVLDETEASSADQEKSASSSKRQKVDIKEESQDLPKSNPKPQGFRTEIKAKSAGQDL